MGLVWSLVTACFFTCSAVGYGYAARRRLDMLPLVAVVATTASLLSAALLLDWGELALLGSQWPLILLMMGVGMAGQSAMLMNGIAMRAAPSRQSTTWTLLQSAMVLPFLSATVRWGENATAWQWLALPCLIAALGLLGPQRKNTPQSESAELGRWARTVALGFCLAGLCQAMAQEASLRGWEDPLDLRVPVSLGAGSLLMLSATGVRRRSPSPQHLRIGMAIGVGVALANVSVFTALDLAAAEGRAFIVYPTAVGGSVLLYSLLQFLRRHEPFDLRKVAGLALGVGGIILLGMKW